MQALLVIDAQNEFSPAGKRPVEKFYDAVVSIQKRVTEARGEGRPIAWMRHFNKPTETAAFLPDSWGAEFIPGFGPGKENKMEQEFHKNVYGAFTGSALGDWLTTMSVTEVLIVGFYTHGCVSTTAREAIMQGYEVLLDPMATATFAMADPYLGALTAREVKNSALLHLVNMGARLNVGDERNSSADGLRTGELTAYYYSPDNRAGTR